MRKREAIQTLAGRRYERLQVSPGPPSHLLLHLVLSVQGSFHRIEELVLIDQTVGPLLSKNHIVSSQPCKTPRQDFHISAFWRYFTVYIVRFIFCFDVLHEKKNSWHWEKSKTSEARWGEVEMLGHDCKPGNSGISQS